MDISVVVPVYNGEKTLAELFSRISSELEGSFLYEVIFVYDCGNDRSWEKISELMKKHPDTVKGIRLARNYGQHNAILYGIKKAEGDYIITMDEDLQHDPVYIKTLIDKQQEEDADVVYARFSKPAHNNLRVWTSEALRRILTVTIPGIFPGYSPFRLIKKDIGKEICTLRNSYTFIDGYLGWVAKKFSTIDARHYKRADGESSYTLFKLIRHATYIEIAYSPLKKWILLIALLLNFISVIMVLAGRNMKISAAAYEWGIILGIVGFSFLTVALIAEVIHHRRLKINSLPVTEINCDR